MDPEKRKDKLKFLGCSSMEELINNLVVDSEENSENEQVESGNAQIDIPELNDYIFYI